MDFMNDIPSGTSTAKIPFDVVAKNHATDSDIMRYPPTHICAICDEMENPKSNLATTKFWLCPDCLEVLKIMVSDYKKCLRLQENMKKYQHD